MGRRFTPLTLLLFLTASLFHPTPALMAAKRLSNSQARDAIRHLAGSDLSKGSVKVRSVSPTSDGGADALAQLRLAFRLTRDDEDRWQIVEVRTGDRRWEDVRMIVSAAGGNLSDERQAVGNNLSSDLTPEHARRVVADLLGVKLPSDAVRVNDVSPFGKSASVETLVELEFHLMNDGGAWRVQKARTAGNGWQDVDAIIGSMNRQKVARANEELRQIAVALETFRRERGFYVEATDEAALIDHLSPQYLKQVIRFDPWSRPYRYEGLREHFTLSSAGPDGKPDTSDDITVSNGSSAR